MFHLMSYSFEKWNPPFLGQWKFYSCRFWFYLVWSSKLDLKNFHILWTSENKCCRIDILAAVALCPYSNWWNLKLIEYSVENSQQLAFSNGKLFFVSYYHICKIVINNNHSVIIIFIILRSWFMAMWFWFIAKTGYISNQWIIREC